MLRKVIVFKNKYYFAVLDFSYKGKFWLKLLRINHGIKEVVVPAKEEINWKWMWRIWSWLWNVIYIYIWTVVMCINLEIILTILNKIWVGWIGS